MSRDVRSVRKSSQDMFDKSLVMDGRFEAMFCRHSLSWGDASGSFAFIIVLNLRHQDHPEHSKNFAVMVLLQIVGVLLCAFFLLRSSCFRAVFMRRVNAALTAPRQELYSDLDTCKRIIKGEILAQDKLLTFFESRAFPNLRLVLAFGLDNAFTSTDESHCRKFVRLVRKLVRVNEGIWSRYMSLALQITSERLESTGKKMSDNIPLVQLVQSTVFQFTMQIISPEDPPHFSISSTAIVVEKINTLWIASKMFPPKDMSEDRKILQDELLKVLGNREGMLGKKPLNLIIPAYEAMWRVVLRCYLEVLYRGESDRHSWQDLFMNFCDNTTKETFQNSDSAISVKHIVNEALRLYPPTKRIYRQSKPKTEQMEAEVVAANVIYLQRDPEIWGSNASVFYPTRWISGTDQQNEKRQEAFLAFGSKPHKCPAYNIGPVLVAILVAALIKNTRDQFDLVASNPVDSVEGSEPLDSNRASYGSLRLCRVAKSQDDS